MGFCFGPFRLEPDEARLLCDDARIAVTPKAFDLLCFLVERAGRLVTKRELLDEVWADAFVGDAVLKVCVRELRKALRDDARQPLYIETVHRRGYRFVARVGLSAAPHAVPPDAARLPVPRDARTKLTETASRAAFVGRGRELAELSRRLELAAGGHSRIVLLAGEPGVGKSALLEAFVAVARAQGVRVLRGRSIELHGPSEPYYPLLEALEGLARDDLEREGTRGDVTAFADLLRHAPTWLAQIPWLLDEEARRRLEHDLLGVTRERMMREFAEVVEALARDQPLVLAIEDLHWSDFATADALAYLASRPPRSRWLVVGTRRTLAGIDPSRSPSSAFDELEHAGLCDQILVERFDEDAVFEYLGARDVSIADRRGIAELAHARTGGNALFLRGLVDELIARGRSRSNDLWAVVPDSTRRWIERQLARLDPREVRLVEAACVAGDLFSSHDVAAALDTSLAEVDSALTALARRCWPVLAAGAEERPEGRAGGRFEFAHALYREVLYAGLPTSERALFHRRVAEAKERAFEGRIESVAAEIAGHFDRAGDLDRAHRYYVLAAAGSARVCAHEESLALLDHADRVVARMRPGHRAKRERFEILEARGHVKLSLGDLRAAASEFSCWRDLASEVGDRDAELRALLALASASSWFDRELCLGSIDEARRLGTIVEDAPARAQSAFWSSYWHLLWSGWTSDGASVAQDAIGVLDATRPAIELGPYLARHSFFLSLGGRHEDAVKAARDARDAALRSGDGFEYLLAAFFEAWSLLESASWIEGARVLEDASHIASRNGHAQWRVLFDLLRALLFVEIGLLDAAAESITRSLVEARALENRFSVVLALVLRAAVAVRCGDAGLAARLFDEVDAVLERGVLMGGLCGRMAARLRVEHAVLLEEHASARRGVERLLEEANARGDAHERVVLEALRAWSLVRAGRSTTARECAVTVRREIEAGRGLRGEPFLERAEVLLASNRGARETRSRRARSARHASSCSVEASRERWREKLLESGWTGGEPRGREDRMA